MKKVFALTLAVLLVPSAARADDRARAEALFEEGLRLYDAKDYKPACEKLAESQKLDPAAGTLLALGRCYESAGRIASAHDAYADAVVQASRDKDAAREKLARDKEAALVRSVPRLLFPSVPDDVKIERDGEALTHAAIAGPVPVDPGAHEIVATSPRKKVTVKVTVAAGETKKVELPSFADDGASSASSTDEHATQRTIAVVGGAAAVLTLGAATYFAFDAKSKKSDADAHCSGRVCDAEGVSLTDKAGTSADLATGLFIAGGALATAAVILWVTIPKSNASVAVGPTGGSVRVRF